MAWISRIEEILNGISRELELPKKGLFLKANTDRSGNKTISYSVCIFEPDYPAKNDNQTPVKNAVVMKNKRKGRLSGNRNIFSTSFRHQYSIECKNKKSSVLFIHVYFYRS